MHSWGLRQGIFIKLIFISHSRVHPLQDTSFEDERVGRRNVAFGSNLFLKNVSHVAVFIPLFSVEIKMSRKKLLAKKLMAQCCRRTKKVERKKMCKQASKHFFPYLVFGIVCRRRQIIALRKENCFWRKFVFLFILCFGLLSFISQN